MEIKALFQGFTFYSLFSICIFIHIGKSLPYFHHMVLIKYIFEALGGKTLKYFTHKNEDQTESLLNNQICLAELFPLLIISAPLRFIS